MKASGRHAMSGAMAADMLARVEPFLNVETVLTWAPTGGQRRRRRGYDQAEELAREMASQSALPILGLLKRVTATAQHGADRARRESVEFVGRPVFSSAHWPQIVIVDDVRTTGATFGAAARAIRDVGGKKIIGIAYAATPSRR